MGAEGCGGSRREQEEGWGASQEEGWGEGRKRVWRVWGGNQEEGCGQGLGAGSAAMQPEALPPT